MGACVGNGVGTELIDGWGEGRGVGRGDVGRLVGCDVGSGVGTGVIDGAGLIDG